MTKTSTVLMPSRNVKLWLLKHEVDDERFLQIFADFATLIRRSERACDKASSSGNPDYADFVVDSEADYLEEIIGASFLVLQTKIRRVQSAAAELPAFMRSQYGLAVSGLDRPRTMALKGVYKASGSSLIELVWAVGNYYKHRDEWPPEVWEEAAPGEKESGPMRQSRATRRMVQKLGIIQSSTGNLRRAYEFLDVDPYSSCAQLAGQVQAWARDVYDEAKLVTAAAQPNAPAPKARRAGGAKRRR